jgi:trigger factor
MDENFFRQVFGNENIDSEEAFTDRVKLELGRALQADAERLLRNDIMEALLDDSSIELPDAFLKRWLKTATEKPVDEATLESQYPEYAKQLRRDLIIDQILKENDLQIDSEQIMNEARGLLYRQFSSYGIPIEEKDLNKYALEYLRKDDNYANLYYSVKFRKVEDHVRALVKVEEKAISYADFEKLTQKKSV